MRETTGRMVAEHQQRNDLGKMGLVIDGKLIEAPTLRSTISDSLVLAGSDIRINIRKIAESLNASR